MLIEFKNISKDFKKVNILHDINIAFESGKIYGLVGRNGTGKSVFLKLLCGFYTPTTGEILFDGENIIKNRTFPKDTRALIEKPNFLPDLTGLENLELLALIQKKITKDDIITTLSKVNLENDMNKKYNEYSLGMKQKLGVAQVLMEDPTIMVFDEPFNGIEEKTAIKLRTLLIEERNKGKLIIIASHIKEDITQLADIVYNFDDGTLTKI